ncbi:MAG: alginate lyase family protein [Candidatus Eisenbacteria bacterium]|nr:alginate lyase family protein [Candidatus Eisenbacteria bacterium]
MNKKFRWFSRRLAAMSWEEILLRAGRQGRDEVERLKCLLAAPSIEDFRAATDEKSRAECAKKFFFLSQNPVRIKEYVAREKPEWLSSTNRKAEEALSHRVSFFGREYYLGDRIEWSRDYSTGNVCPLRFWTRINYRDSEKFGDHKVTWELNRHQHLVPLSKGYFYTSDERYLREIVSQLDDWTETNPFLKGINWTSPLELALRLISWAWIFNFLGDSIRANKKFYEKFLLSAYLHADHIEKNLSLYSSANNHLIGECTGLLFAGLAFPQCLKSRRWVEKASSMLWDEAVAQIYEDGIGKEQATDYLLFVVELYMLAFILSERNGLRVPEKAKNRIERSLEFIMYITDREGNVPRIGDSDEGKAFTLSENDDKRARALLSVGGIYFGRKEFSLSAGRIHEEALWLLGLEAMDDESSAAGQEIELSSKVFEKGGYSVMRCGEGTGEKLIVFDFGELGYLSLAAHGHADCLSLCVSASGEELLVDPGTYSYHTEPDFREYFRGTFAHNALSIDKESQSESLGPFLWGKRARGRLRMWFSDRVADFAEAEHDGYESKFSATHVRGVAFVKPEGLVVCDTVCGKGTRSAVIRWHLPPGSNLISSGEEGVTVATPGGNQILFAFFSTTSLSQEWIEGKLNPPQGWFSPHLGLRIPCPTLEIGARGELPFSVTSLIFPLGKLGLSRKIRMRHLSGANSSSKRQIHGLALGKEEAVEYYYVNYSDEEVAFDSFRARGKFVFLKEVRGKVDTIFGTELAYVERDGKKIVEVSPPVEALSCDLSKETPLLGASSPTRVRLLLNGRSCDFTAGQSETARGGEVEMEARR